MPAFDCSVTPEQRLEAADAKTIDLFMPGEALNAELPHQPHQPLCPELRVPNGHTAASVWFGSGADPKLVQRMLGRASAAMDL